MNNSSYLLTNPYAVLMSGSATLGLCPSCHAGSLKQERRQFSLMAPGAEYATLQDVPELDEAMWVAVPHRFSAHFRCDNPACFEGSMVQGTTTATKVEGCGCSSCLERGYHMDFALRPTSVTLAPDLIAVPSALDLATADALRGSFLLAYGHSSAALGLLRICLELWIKSIIVQQDLALTSDENLNLHRRIGALRQRKLLTDVEYGLAISIKNMGNAGAHNFEASEVRLLEMLKLLARLFEGKS